MEGTRRGTHTRKLRGIKDSATHGCDASPGLSGYGQRSVARKILSSPVTLGVRHPRGSLRGGKRKTAMAADPSRNSECPLTAAERSSPIRTDGSRSRWPRRCSERGGRVEAFERRWSGSATGNVSSVFTASGITQPRRLHGRGRRRDAKASRSVVSKGTWGEMTFV